MKLPRTLYVGYNLLKKSRVAVKKENDEEALSYFQNILNEAQPTTPEDIALHRFVKGMYNENKHRFLSFIKNTSFECLVLWTESRSIVNYLGLRGVVYAKWTGKETLYSVTQFQSTEMGENVADPTSYEHPLVRRQRKQKETKDQKIKFNAVTVMKREAPTPIPESAPEETSELVTDGKAPEASKDPEETVDSPDDDELIAPEVPSLTRMSSVAMGTDKVAMSWGDICAGESD
jgi:hypothetical protein